MRRTKLKLAEVSIGGGNKMWCVTWPKAGSGRNRQFFKNKAEAKTLFEQKQIDLENFGRAGIGLTDRERNLFHDCCEDLKPFGKMLRDATNFYVEHLKATSKSCTVEQLTRELLIAKEADGVRERQLRDLRSRLGVFAEKFNGQPVATITSAQIDDWLRSLPVAPLTRKHYRAAVSVAFKHAIGRYAAKNPVEQTAKIKVPHHEIGILTITRATRLLESSAPELLPYIAIGLFAGLRASEIERLDWSDINFTSGLIKVEAVKGTRQNTRRRRFVKIMPNLRGWLLPFRKLKGRVTPTERFRQLFDQARIAAGFKDSEGRLAHWPDNALRHSFASYHLAHFKDEKTLALEMGNSPDVIIARYRELVKPADANQFWQITPKGASNVVAFGAAAS